MQATKLKHQLTYEQQRDLRADADAAKKEVEKIQDNLSKLEEEARAAAEAAKADEQELAAEVHMTARHMTFISRGSKEDAYLCCWHVCRSWTHLALPSCPGKDHKAQGQAMLVLPRCTHSGSWRLVPSKHQGSMPQSGPDPLSCFVQATSHWRIL